MASTEKSFTVSGSTVTYTGTISGYRYEYDENNNLTKLVCNIDSNPWYTVYTYDSDNRPSSAMINSTTGVMDFYDSLGRAYARRLMMGYQMITINRTYVSGSNGSKTALVSTYKNGTDDAYNYTYDANGNITQIWRGSGTFANASVKFSYSYDNANQLIRENLYYGSGNSNNATYAYEYDSWGNLVSKKRYIYTTVVNLIAGTELETITYGYSNSQWADLLTSYNGQSITYDNMGNPTSYLGKTLEWEGKKLISAQIPVTAGRIKTAEYAYNEDGLRLSKVYDGTTTEYYYNGSVLIGMKIGTGSTAKILCFSYDASGNVIAVDYSENNGSTFNSYFYLRNAQNDIVKIVDNTGAAVVEYIYDSWGKILSATGTLANTVGLYQPFRYRGYVYDTETGWYYLQSRYYDPATCRFISADVLLSTGQGIIGHNSFAYCNNNPINMTDYDGEAPWYLIWPNWGYIHKKVQNKIEEIYGYVCEVPCLTGVIDIVNITNDKIWEVKSCGPAALLADGQLTRYTTSNPEYSRGVGIDANWFLDKAPNGTQIWIMYWEAEPGVILYAWGKTKEEMLRDARLALGGAAAIELLFGINELCDIISSTLGPIPPVFGGGGLFGSPNGGILCPMLK